MSALSGQLVTVDEVKDLLDQDHGGHEGLIQDLILDAEGEMLSHIGLPFTPSTFTEHHNGGTSRLFLKRWPLDESTVTVTDQDDPGTATDDTELTQDDDYRVAPEKGEIIKISSTGAREGTFGRGVRRFKVEYDAGLNLYDGWDISVKRDLRNSIRRLVVARFNRRNPELRDRTSGGNVRRTFEWDERTGLPKEVLRTWNEYVCDVGLGGP